MANSSPSVMASAARWMTLGLCLLLGGCGDEHGDPVVEFEEGDPEMNAAINQAQWNMSEFLGHLRAHPDDSSSMIKAPINTGQADEFIWINNLSYDGRQFTGTLANRPYDLSTYELGDEVTVPREAVADWQYLHNGITRGGYTTGVIQRRVASESAEHQAL